MNRLTRLCCSIWGMVFLVTGLFVGVWSELDTLELIQRAVLSGIAGLVCGYIVGKTLSYVFKKWLNKAELETASSAEETRETDGDPKETPKLQPWNPPRVNRDDQGRQ